MKYVNSFNELYAMTNGSSQKSTLAVFNDSGVEEIENIVRSLDKTWSLLEASLDVVYQASIDMYHSRDQSESAAHRAKYENIRSFIPGYLNAMRQGVARITDEIKQEADRIAQMGDKSYGVGNTVDDATRAYANLMRKQQQVKDTYLGNEFLLGKDAFQIVPVRKPKLGRDTNKQQPKFASREEAEAYFAAR